MSNPTDVLIDDAIAKVQSTVSKAIALRLVPFVTLLLVPVAAWAQAKVGIDLDPTALAVFVGSSIIGLAGVAASYIRERMKGIYSLHSTLIDNAINVEKKGREELDKIPLPKNV